MNRRSIRSRAIRRNCTKSGSESDEFSESNGKIGKKAPFAIAAFAAFAAKCAFDWIGDNTDIDDYDDI